MALAQQHEVIDLISDSEDESPRKSAISTLQAFVPRKEKVAPRTQRTIAPPASTPQPTNRTPVAPKPLAPAPAPKTTDSWSNIPADASIAELLSHGLQSAARSAGLLPRQPQQQPQQPPLVCPPSNVVNSFYRNGAPPGRPYSPINQGQSNSSVQHKQPPTAIPARKVPRTNGPLHEERERRFIQYHQKEAERKGTKASPLQVERVVDTANGTKASPNGGVTAQQNALPSTQPNGSLSAHLQQQSLADGPEAKRRKLEHEAVDDKIATGMSEARRLSAAAITANHESATHDQEPDRAVFNNGPSSLVEDGKGAMAPARPQHESIDLTEEMDVCIDDSQPSIVVNRASSKQDSETNAVNLATATSPNDDTDEEESDSPDEIPAKPVRGRPSTVTREELLRSILPAPFHVPPKALTMSKNDPNFDTDLQIDLETRNDPLLPPKVIGFAGAVNNSSSRSSNHGIPYTAEEDSLLVHLREDLGIGWEAMPKYFCGRTRGSLQVRYSSKLKNRNSVSTKPRSSGLQKSSLPGPEAAMQLEYSAPSRRHPKAAQQNDGFVSWAQIKAQRQEDRATVKSATPPTCQKISTPPPSLGLDFAHPASLPRILRSRELGNTGRRNWSSTARLSVSDELQNHVLDTLGPRRYFHGASRDVTCVAWAADGNKFAAGAIAIDDERSMQYNRPNNLLLGNLAQNSLHELPEHHVARPIVSDSRNVNSLQAMQETQDARLFKTVAAVGFSEDSRALYSAGADGVVRMYDSSNGQCLSSLRQGAELALLTSNSKGLLASGSHRSDDSSISVIRSHSDRLECLHQFGPTRADVQSSLPIFPTALKWGAGMHSHLLLAGFASDSYEDDRLDAGEVFLWDSTADQKIELPAARNVFDVAWNPIPSSKASLFAVASARPGKKYRSTVQCFAPNQGRASRVLEWDCPAFDINDLVYCPHDDDLIAAGATDGKVYIWDKRVAGKAGCEPQPLHILSHGKTKNVLDHDRDVEIADTGVRFLSWSATGNRLYSGSSDGTVKVWNPYRTTEDALVKDVATFNSAVMSGAFSPDFRDLLIGEDAGQLNLLGIDREARSVRAAKTFDYYPAPAPVSTMDEDKLAPARELLASGQVEVRPMGALPVKQVVQGPNYQGPFGGPSDDEISHLQAEFELVLSRQMDAEKALHNNPQDPELNKAFKAASSQIMFSAEASNRMSEEREKYEALRLKASILQDKFHESRCAHERAFGQVGAKACQLDCNYLPSAGDEDGEAPDNQRHEQRIPDSLRTQGKVFDTSDMTNAEIAEAGLTSKCSACMGPAAKSKRGLPVCSRCTLIRSGLTARCEKCAAPVRPNLDESVQHNICERCNFHCFRCGGVAAVLPTGDTITCKPCGIQWEAGVLGYEVKRKSRNSPTQMRDRSHEQLMESLDERMGRLLGEDERERLAGGWRVALVDGSVGY